MDSKVNERVAEIGERAEKATPGPWVAWVGSCDVEAKRHLNNEFVSTCADPDTEFEDDDISEEALKQRQLNAYFIAASREDVPYLLALVQAQEREAAEIAEINAALRRKIHIVEGHNQWFERCESAFCHPDERAFGNPALTAFKEAIVFRTEAESKLQAQEERIAEISQRSSDAEQERNSAERKLAGLLSAAKAARELTPLLGGLDSRPSWFTDDAAWEAWVNLDEALRAAIAEAGQ
jgi:hypothetical protein